MFTPCWSPVFTGYQPQLFFWVAGCVLDSFTGNLGPLFLTSSPWFHPCMVPEDLQEGAALSALEPTGEEPASTTAEVAEGTSDV